MLDHPDEKTIIEFFRENLAPVESDQIASHLDRCPICQTTAENLINQISASSGCTTKDQHRTRGTNTFGHEGLVEADADLDESTPQIPKNRFLIIGELARGGMGIVYRGFDRILKRQVAIKVPRQNFRDPNSYRLCREADISSQLQHPGVVPIYERGQLTDGRPYLVMKLIEGKTLSEKIRASDSNRLDLLRIFGDIVQTMAYVHSLNYVHRDLKPQNVMIGKFGEVQIIDWGLAKRLNLKEENPKANFITDQQPIKQSSGAHARIIGQSDCAGNDLPSTCTAIDGSAFGETQIGAIMGSRGYMSPEQSQGLEPSKRSDVFAIGSILFQILTGDALCDIQTVTEESFLMNADCKAINFKLNRPLVELEGIDCAPEIIALCKACLSETPIQRPQDAQAVNALLVGHDFYSSIGAGPAFQVPIRAH